MNISEVEVLDIYEFDKQTSNKKKGNIKIVLLIIISLIIVLFGVGLYFFLKYAKETTKVTELKDQIVELGTEINEKSINFKSDNKNCKIDLSNVDTSVVGSYKYYVTCNKRRYSANIEVKDTTVPKVELKIANIKVNESLEPKKFILASYDLSKIEYSFFKDFKIDDYNKENGVYIVPFNVFDEYKNTKEVQGILLVSNLVANKFLSATKVISTNYDATLEINDKIGFNQVDYYINALRIYNYTFNSESEYKKVKEEYISNASIDGIQGQVIYDEENLNIKLILPLTREKLNELNGTFPFTYNDIQKLYASLNYNNKIEMN